MTPLEAELRLESVQLLNMSVEEMGLRPGVQGRFGLLDESSRTLAFVVCRTFSPQTMELLGQLYESMEIDVATILAKGEAEKVSFLSTDGHAGPTYP